MTILEFIQSKKYLSDDSLSVPQEVILRAIYGLPMSEAQLAQFSAMSEGKSPRKGGYEEISLGCGRRSGKTEKIAANIAAYEAMTFDRRQVSEGETPYVVIVAQNKKQAHICRDYIEAKLRFLEDKRGILCFAKTPGQEKPVTAEEIRLDNGVVIAAFPCKKVAVRGITCFCFIADEIGHWQVEENAYNADVEVIRAIKPSMATLKRRRLIKISTPFTEAGVFFEDWKKKERSRQLVIHEIPTELMNPAISKAFLAQEQLDDPESFQREYLAKWSGVGGTFISRETVEQCIESGVSMRAPKAGQRHIARIDAAFKHDLFALAIGHPEGERVVCDLVKWWKPPHPKRPLNMAEVVGEIVIDLRIYGVDSVMGDQHCDIPLREEFQKYGIKFHERPVSIQSQYDMFKNLRAVMQAKRLLIPDEPMVRRDLLSLQATKTQGGLYRVAAPKLKGYHDDISNAIGGVVVELLKFGSGLDIAELNRGASAHALLPPWDRESGRPSQPSDKHDAFAEDIMGAIL